MDKKEYKQIYNLINKDRIKKQRHEYYIKNMEDIKNKTKEYKELNRKKIQAYKKNYDLKNKSILNQKCREYNKNNPDIILKSQIKQLNRLSKILGMKSDKYIWALQAWSKTIKKLDNYMCKNCDSKKDLNAHHLMPKNDFPELSLNLDNGVTLCKKCHGLVHGFEIFFK